MNASQTTALFTAGPFCAIELGSEDVPRLQLFVESNPEYFLAVTGESPRADEAEDIVHGLLPDGFSFTKKWSIGFIDAADSLVGMASVVSDVLATGVWHIGLFVIATRLHGSGTAGLLYALLERWAHGMGAKWLRLGVVVGNTRAERFWKRCAFAEVRKRDGVELGARTHSIRVMVKPLDGGSLPEYLARVARDRPEA